MEVQNKNVEEQGKMNKQIVDEQRELRSQLTKLTNSLATQNTRGVNAITTRSGKVVDRPSPSTSQPIRVNDVRVEIDEGELSILLPFP